jgi:hypothetical protein
VSEASETTVTLYGAKDGSGRLYLVDRRERLPPGAEAVTEFRVAPEKVEWAILQVRLEELRLTPVAIRVGDYAYATPPLPGLPQAPGTRAGGPP